MAEETAALLAAGDKMRESLQIPCTGCDYCNICPQEIAIPKIFAIANKLQLDGNWMQAEADYKALEGHTADKCVECGACVQACPQYIKIFEELAKVHKRIV